MTNISFSTGTYKEYTLNGTETIRVNVSDPGLIDRLKAATARCDEISNKYEDLTEDNIGELDKEIRDMIDTAINCPGACDKAFGNTHCFAMADGRPVFMNFLDALLEQLAKDVKATVEAAAINNSLKANNTFATLENERTQKYITPAITQTKAGSTINLSALSQEERERVLRELLEEKQ